MDPAMAAIDPNFQFGADSALDVAYFRGAAYKIYDPGLYLMHPKVYILDFFKRK